MSTLLPQPSIELSHAAGAYARDGFYVGPKIYSDEFVQRAAQRMDAVIAGEYETGIAPKPYGKPGPNQLCKIDEAHLSDRTLFELVSAPALGQLAAAVTGAKWIQVWAVQLLFKPPGGLESGNVGWHQDKQYWPYWDGETFTAWIALSDVTADAGPMRFVRGSHQWGLLNGGDFFDTNLDQTRQRFAAGGRPWEEAVGILPPGGVSFHHNLTVHGSGPNTSRLPRRSLAVHMRTDRSTPQPAPGGRALHEWEAYYLQHLDDPTRTPVIFGG